MANKFIKAILLAGITFLSVSSRADVVDPTHTNRQFMFTNLDKFPGLTFYCFHYGYHYNRGWQANAADTVLLENNKRYTVSERGSNTSILIAKPKKGKYILSIDKVGGSAYKAEDVESIIDVYTIVSVNKGVIKIKKMKEIVRYKNGEEKEKQGGLGIATFFGGDGFTTGLALASAAALFGLLLLFVLKIKKPKYIQLAT